MPAAGTPMLHLDGFDGLMDLLLDLVERQRIDLGRMSILGLVEQFLAASDQMRDRVPIERRADWLVMATRLVLLRSRLLFPESPEAASAAEQEAATELRRLDELVAMRAAAAWLGAQPILGCTDARTQISCELVYCRCICPHFEGDPRCDPRIKSGSLRLSSLLWPLWLPEADFRDPCFGRAW
jgi:hypothetical protein